MSANGSGASSDCRCDAIGRTFVRHCASSSWAGGTALEDLKSSKSSKSESSDSGVGCGAGCGDGFAAGFGDDECGDDTCFDGMPGDDRSAGLGLELRELERAGEGAGAGPNMSSNDCSFGCLSTRLKDCLGGGCLKSPPCFAAGSARRYRAGLCLDGAESLRCRDAPSVPLAILFFGPWVLSRMPCHCCCEKDPPRDV